jgi:hypothetical protein
MSSPTKDAESAFVFVMHHLQGIEAKGNSLDPATKAALMNMAWGMKNLSVGVRATYMLLESVQKELRQLNRAGRP